MTTKEEVHVKSKWMIPGIIIAVIVLIGLIVVGPYNGLVASRESVNGQLANIQSQYQRRADLVPNLVNTVKGAANFEQETLNQVVSARTKATQTTIDASNATPEQIAEYQRSQGELSQALGRLIAITENYPELKATQSFRDLQTQLEGTENRIAVARNDFNEAARQYNTKVQVFPSNITASIFGFKSFTYFQAESGADKAPDVNFN